MALFSLQDGGLLGEYQEAASDAPQLTAAAAAFSRDDKALCAVAYPDSCIVVTSPWRQQPCAVKGHYMCPKVHTPLGPVAPSCNIFLHVHSCKLCFVLNAGSPGCEANDWHGFNMHQVHVVVRDCWPDGLLRPGNCPEEPVCVRHADHA